MSANRKAMRSSAAQAGQAMIEFLVFALVMTVLFIAVPLVGKYIDLMQTAEQASRYAAFEAAARNTRSTWKSDADLGVEVRRRFFSNSDAFVKTNDAAGNFTANRNPVWTDDAGRPLLASFVDNVKVTSKTDNKNAIAAASLYRDELGLSDTNFYTASVNVKPDNVINFVPFNAIDLSISRKTVLLADAWTGFNRDDIRHRIENSFTMFPIGPAKGLVNTLGEVPALLFDPELRIGEFDWDIVPCDRLVGGC